jgi:hypothetical protein
MAKGRGTRLSFETPNGVYMRLANFRLSIRCIRLKASAALSRDGYGTEEVWTEEFDAGYPSLDLERRNQALQII